MAMASSCECTRPRQQSIVLGKPTEPTKMPQTPMDHNWPRPYVNKTVNGNIGHVKANPIDGQLVGNVELCTQRLALQFPSSQ
ncbi:hypothetical protein BLOT_007484 [Blomia tropicalis]|nr:hypothetical protein BLOT_007484 [Blomia tropicalis]